MDLLINTKRGEVMCSNTTTVSVQPNHKRFAQWINIQVTSNNQILRSQVHIFVTFRAKVVSVPTNNYIHVFCMKLPKSIIIIIIFFWLNSTNL
jgi:hypothetical protein